MWASSLDVVAVHVCFRTAPEFEDPAGMLDVVAAVKWAVTNGADFGIDTSRVGLACTSAGGFVATTAALELAARKESEALKVVILEVPSIIPDTMLTCVGMPAFRTFINENVLKGQYIWMAGGEGDKADWKKRFNEKDLTLHCLHAPAELMEQLPKHVIISAEYDDFRWQTDEYAAKLHQGGVLADYVLYPGGVHMDTMNHTGILWEVVEMYLR
jgi:acetyl esterase/lipase